MDTKVIKRFLSLALTLCMIVTILPPVAMAEYVSPFQDIDGFWANDAIKFVHEKGCLGCDSGGAAAHFVMFSELSCMQCSAKPTPLPED